MIQQVDSERRANRLTKAQQTALDALIVARKAEIEDGSVSVETLASRLSESLGRERLTVNNVMSACVRVGVKPSRRRTSNPVPAPKTLPPGLSETGGIVKGINRRICEVEESAGRAHRRLDGTHRRLDGIQKALDGLSKAEEPRRQDLISLDRLRELELRVTGMCEVLNILVRDLIPEVKREMSLGHDFSPLK